MLTSLTISDVEHWIEGDTDIDEDVMVENSHIPPPEVEFDSAPCSTEVDSTIRWIIMLLSVFQTQFYLTNRALGWLLKFISVLLRFLGRFSSKIAEIGLKFPQTLHRYGKIIPSMLPNASFERRAVCKSCESIYKLEECLKKVGSRTDVMNCKSKPFKPLMREIRSITGNTKFYPHKVYRFVSLISSLQTLIMRTGFVEQCESTRNAFSNSGLSDIYDGSSKLMERVLDG